MTPQEIAKGIDSLRWSNIQCDDPAEGAKLNVLRDELNKLPFEKQIDILFMIIEAQNLPDDFLNEHRIMHEFNYL